MQGGRGRGSFFDSNPFAGFSAFGGFGGHQSLMPSFFGGSNPFDDPFFNQPMGSMFDSSFFGPRSSPFPPFPPPFANAPQAAGFIEQQEPQANKRRGPVIEELSSDDEKVENGGASKSKDNPRKHSRIDKEPYVEIPDDEADGGRNTHIQQRAEFGNRMNNAQPQSQFYSFQSSTMSYGGGNGAYYTKSMTRRAGSDGVAFEEYKEADSTTGQANHKISRGLHNKGHTLAKKLNSDGNVDTKQMLHNLNEPELDDFDQAWEGSSGRHFTGSRQRFEGGNYGSGDSYQANRGGWALPSTQQPLNPGGNNSHVASGSSGAHVQRMGRKASDQGFRGRRRA